MERFRRIVRTLIAWVRNAFESLEPVTTVDVADCPGASSAAASLRGSNNFRRRLTIALFLLMSSPWLSTVVHADAASCIELRNFMNAQNCTQGQLNSTSSIMWYCYATPYPSRPGSTAVYSYGYEIYNGTWDNGGIDGIWDCSIDPVANVGTGDMTDGGLGGPNCGCSDNSGNPAGSPNVGDPINASTGNKYAQEDDFVGTPGLTFRRFYNSFMQPNTNIGVGWTHSFNRSLRVAAGTPNTPLIQALRPDGKTFVFFKTNGTWTPSIKTPDQLIETDNAKGAATSYTLFVAAYRLYETYDTNGVLQSIKDETGQGDTLTYSTATTPSTIAPKTGLLIMVTNPQGRQLNLIYNSNSQVSQVTLPDGGALTYTYDSKGNLSTAQYPDGKIRQYVYNESSLTGGKNLPNAMTGVVDESSTRYANTTYNSNGLATSTGFAGNVGSTQITYNSDSSATVQYPLGLSATVQFNSTNGAAAMASLSQSCGPQCNQAWKTRTYDTNGYPASYTDFNANQVQTTYDANDLLTQEIDAPSTANQRTTAMTWNSALRVPLTRTVTNASGTAVASTQWVYNGNGQVLARCEIDPSNSATSGYTCANTGTVPAGVRRWTYTYCTAIDTTQCPLIGLLLTAAGPRTDSTQTTTYSYYLSSSATNCGTPGAACYQPGDLHTITDASGHVTTIASYDGAGRVTRITDANGINTDLTYTPRGWLASRSVGGVSTAFTYTSYGAVQTVTDPDGVTMTYGYDAAHRLVKITSSSGDYVQYTLDAASDKTAEQAYDANGNARKSLSRTFNTLGQLTTVVDGLNHTVFNASTSGSYDANGNLVQSTDGLGIQRQLSYDALNRLVQTLDNYNGTN